MRVELSLLCVALVCLFKQTNSCLMISEVNCDNPKLDTQEFVELYYEGANPTSLDGYTLVFYNGKGDLAYRVIDLTGHHTDQRGFFIVGSSELTPRPAISLPPNSVQNGPDAIALYGPNWVPVPEGGRVSGVGLLDAVVYTSRKSVDGADGLASVLTPGSVPYVEDEAALEGDESIQRCWQSENLWTFYTGPPTPAWVNHCPPPTPAGVWINEVDLGSDQRGHVELSIGEANGSYSLVFYDVSTDLISMSLEFIVKTPGIFAIPVNTASLSVPQSAALALYKGSTSDFPKDGPLSHEQPIDAFVYGGLTHMPSDNLTETLIPGRKAFKLTESFLTEGLHVSRCGVAEWTRDPGLFVARPRSPGKHNDCVWFQSCPLNMTSFTMSGRIQPPIHSDVDFLLNEINTDSPGGAEDEEFIELWHPSGFRMSLDFIWLVMINGQTGMVYYELELNGYYTDNDGYFLIGSSKVGPDIRIPSNTIQNGPDAIVLYRSKSPPSKEGQNIPKRGLLDAVVYRTRGTDKKVSELTDALTPGQLPLLEDISALTGDETLSRCGTERLDLNAFRVSSPTPRKQNNCPPKPTIPPPPKGLVINEWGRTSAVNQSQESLFVELTGPPSTSLNGLVMVFFGEDATELHVPLTGSTGSDGLYLVANDSLADQSLPTLGHLGAVLLCFEASGSGSCGSDSHHLDWLVFSDDPKLRRVVQHDMTPFVYTLFSPNSLSRCASDGPILWIASQPTPRLSNRCPSPAFSSSVDLCLQPNNDHWQSGSGDCGQEEFAFFLEQLCDCGICGLHVKGVNVSCEADRLYAQGSVLAVSDQQRERITEVLNNNKLLCSAEQERQVHGAGSPVALQVGLVLAALLLFALGAALFVYLYRKRRPADYLSMQLSEQAETPLDL
ncbi:uncharacterized protein [Garra rufa]|uniref:uncharacterized protein n=1 Tax=Garra rufa TaxID=137080 RepID=UPI003CCE72E0